MQIIPVQNANTSLFLLDLASQLTYYGVPEVQDNIIWTQFIILCAQDKSIYQE